MEINKYDLKDRLIRFACMCLDICDSLPSTRAANNLEHQLAKSATAPALLYVKPRQPKVVVILYTK